MAKVAGGDSILGMGAAAAIAVPFGVVVALPALRLQGLYLALVTFALAQVSRDVIFQDTRIYGKGGVTVGRLELFGIDFAGDKAFAVLCAHRVRARRHRRARAATRRRSGAGWRPCGTARRPAPPSASTSAAPSWPCSRCRRPSPAWPARCYGGLGFTAGQLDFEPALQRAAVPVRLRRRDHHGDRRAARRHALRRRSRSCSPRSRTSRPRVRGDRRRGAGPREAAQRPGRDALRADSQASPDVVRDGPSRRRRGRRTAAVRCARAASPRRAVAPSLRLPAALAARPGGNLPARPGGARPPGRAVRQLRARGPRPRRAGHLRARRPPPRRGPGARPHPPRDPRPLRLGARRATASPRSPIRAGSSSTSTRWSPRPAARKAPSRPTRSRPRPSSPPAR